MVRDVHRGGPAPRRAVHARTLSTCPNVGARAGTSRVSAGDHQQRAQMTRKPWNAARGHRGGDGELDIRARARAREREREVVSLRNGAACSDAFSDLYHGKDPHPPP